MIISVAQLGSRMHYAVPKILADHNLLGQFFTDICSDKFPFSILNRIPSVYLPNAVKRFTTRKVGINNAQVVHFPTLGIHYFSLKKGTASLSDEFGSYNTIGKQFCEQINRQKWYQSCDAIYLFNTAGKEVAELGKKENKTIILEQCIIPAETYFKILEQEALKFPEWGGKEFLNYASNPVFDTYFERERLEWQLADNIIVPSKFVHKTLVELNVPTEKITVVPYGVKGLDSIQLFNRKPKEHNKNGKLNVVSIGYLDLRKGIQYYYQLAEIYKGAHFSAIGQFTKLPETIQKKISTCIRITGHLNKNEVVNEYLNSDIFMLLTLAEGSATVIYEALSYGLPVITTNAAGSIVEHGISGFIVEASDTEGIIACLEKLKQKDFYTTMSQNALLKSQEGSFDSYSKNLIESLNRISR